MRVSLLAISVILILFACSQPVEIIDSYEMEISIDVLNNLPKTRSLGIIWDKYPLGDNEVGPPKPIFPTKDSFPTTDVDICDPWVIKVSDTEYKMWYTIITDEVDTSGKDIRVYRIGYSTSADGINWSAHAPVASLVPNAANTYDKPVLGGLRVVSVIRTPYYNSGFLYKMWYLGKESVNSIKGWKLYYAWSYDGVNWTKKYHNKIYQVLGKNNSNLGEFYETSIRGGSVLKDGTDYFMWLGGYDKDTISRIGSFSSNLGTQEAWKLSNVVAEKGFAGTFDRSEVALPFVLKDDGVYKMWYTGKYHTHNLGLAYSLDGKSFYYYSDIIGESYNAEVMRPHHDGTRWERYGYEKVCIIRDDDISGAQPVTRYKMWFTAKDNLGKFRVGYAESHERDE